MLRTTEAPHELFEMGTSLCIMIAFTEIEIDEMESIGVDDGEVLRSWFGIEAALAWRMAQLYTKSNFSQGGVLKVNAIPLLRGICERKAK